MAGSVMPLQVPGGMCATLLATLEGGYTLLVTDGDDTLAWDRAEHRGWTVGLYSPGEEGGGSGLVEFVQTERSDVAGLLQIVPSAIPGAQQPR